MREFELNNLDKVKTHPNLVVKHFSNEMPALLQNADLAISRAGAGAICELMVTKTHSILIPFQASADQHQDLNAAYMARFGGAVIVKQHNSKDNILRNILFNLLSSNSLMKMKSNMNSHDYLNPVHNIVELLQAIS